MQDGEIIGGNSGAILVQNYSGSVSIEVRGGLVFAPSRFAIVDLGSVSYEGATGNGMVIAWDREAGRTVYAPGSTVDLIRSPTGGAAMAVWDTQGGAVGISYANGSNIGFIPLEVTTGLMELAKEDLIYTIPVNHVQDGTPKGIGTVTCSHPDFNATTGGAIAVLYDGNPALPINTGAYDVSVRIGGGTMYAATDISLGVYFIAEAAKAPGAPRSVTAVPGNGQVSLTWDIPASDGGSAILRYEVSSDEGSAWTSASSSTSHTFTGLQNGRSYTFQVRAVNAIGPGPAVSVTATPTAGGGNGGNGGGSGSSSSGGRSSGSGGSSTADGSYAYRTLTDRDTGVSISGYMTADAALTVRPNHLHTAESGCAACTEIRTARQAGQVLALYDISLSGAYRNGVEVSIPVGGEYSGQTMTVLHCLNREPERKALTVKEGSVTGAFATLSPFAVLVPDSEIAADNGAASGSTHNPQTGDFDTSPWRWLLVLIPAAALTSYTAALLWKRLRITGTHDN